MISGFIPLGSRIVVQLDEKERQVGSILVPDFSYVSAESMATVLAIGKGWETENGTTVPLEVKPGDRVCVIRLHEKTDTQRRIQESIGDGVLILSENDVVYVLRDGKPIPLRDKVIVKADAAEVKTAGGIVIPEDAKQKQLTGTVAAVGSGRINKVTGQITPVDVKVGDKVLFWKYAGTDFKLDDVEHLVLREDDILGVLE